MAENTVSQITPTVKEINPIHMEFLNGKTPAVLSTEVAKCFLKKHRHILRDIDRLRSILPKSFYESNFGRVEYTDAKGENRRAFLLTRDGFTLLAMGFTGKTALAWKVRYIEAFNAMEAALRKKAGKFVLKHTRQKALPSVPQLSYRERCAEVTAKMLRLRGELFTVSTEMVTVFRNPFWGGVVPEDKKTFADAMNYAIQSFWMVINKDLDAIELLFKAYVEGEKVLNACSGFCERHPESCV